MPATAESQVRSQGVDPQQADEVARIRAEIAALKAETDRRIADLEARLAALASAQSSGEPAKTETSESTPAEPFENDELAALREAARQAVAASAESAQAAASTTARSAAAVGKERNLSLLNPEISLTGIFLGTTTSGGRDEFSVEEFELDLQSALDPYSRTRVTLAVGEEGVELEEIYVNYSGLPGGLDLYAGKFRQRFGPLNRQHLHALPQSEYPLAYQTYFGDEGLAQTGLSFNWLLPKPWASANKVTIEITDGDNEVAFGGENFEDFAILGRLENFWDVSSATYFEWGLSAIDGKTAAGAGSRVYGTDFTLGWQPPGRAKYRGVTWRTELLQAEREDEFGVTRKARGGYTYVEGLMRRNLYGGVRVDRAEDPLDPDLTTTGIVPYFTWWQSEYVRLRAEYGLFELRPSGESEDRFALQLTWAAGPHKHESY